MPERALAAVNVAAIARNCTRVTTELASGVALCAVVKAEGYGHGAARAARAVLAAGASWLAVATAAEAAHLRSEGIDARLLVMGALTPADLDTALGAGADVVAWTEEFVAAVAARGGGRVHVELDSGMGRLGTREPDQATRVAQLAADTDAVELAGAMTHFATADEIGDSFLDEQRERFDTWARALQRRHPSVVLHAANSAATLRDRRTHYDMVRCGVALYGMDPFGENPAARGLEAALELRSHVAALKPTRVGESAGYGRRFIAERDTCLAVLPIGYGDGWRRGLTNNADVLIGGRRHPLVGAVSMDNVTVDVGPDPPVGVGDEAVLLGRDGAEVITAEEVARRLATINYEITCGLTARVPRRAHLDGHMPAEAGMEAPLR